MEGHCQRAVIIHFWITNFREVVATFEVSYRDKSLDELYNDTYLGSFTLLFELGM